jgi:hypothetical protein
LQSWDISGSDSGSRSAELGGHEGRVGPGAGLPQEIASMKEWAAFATAVGMVLLVQMLIVGF